MKNKSLIQRILKFAGVGVAATVVDFATYQIGVNFLFDGDLTLSVVLSGVVATVAAYIMHNNITWKERDPGRYGVVTFFVWNAIAVFLLRPPLTWILGYMTGLYQFAYFLTSWIFSYEFVESTGVYVLMTLVIMVLNYRVYERFVFTGKEKAGTKEPEKAKKQRLEKKGEKLPKN